MKNPRFYRMPRSLAHSAGAAVIILAAALTSAAPVAAQSAAPPGNDKGKGQSSSCVTSNTQRQGLENIVWSVLFGPQNNTTDTRCDGDGDEAKENQEEAPGFLSSLPGS
ncbi:hypothetical protein ACFT4A_12480 [Streptomyces sp. NPDC057099]|uniref:hypothetical protein n=1 Tax=Streptomyces sp. NPDC057099 TaxID=3346019 RepID=UPI0036315324